MGTSDGADFLAKRFRRNTAFRLLANSELPENLVISVFSILDVKNVGWSKLVLLPQTGVDAFRLTTSENLVVQFINILEGHLLVFKHLLNRQLVVTMMHIIVGQGRDVLSWTALETTVHARLIRLVTSVRNNLSSRV